jgi:hypothetical protein
VRSPASAHEPEERADLVDEEVRLLEGGEVAAGVGLAPVADVGEAPLGPAARRSLELLGEDRTAGGNRDGVIGLPGDPLVDLPDALPVQAGR